MACRGRADVVNVMEKVEALVFVECQRGAFNTNATQLEREAIKALIRQARLIKMIVAPKKQEFAMEAPLPLGRQNY